MVNIRYVAPQNKKRKSDAGPGDAAAAAGVPPSTANMTTASTLNAATAPISSAATTTSSTSNSTAIVDSVQSSCSETITGDATAERTENNTQQPTDHPENPRPHKKRKTLSCFPCRDRKMKCDRVYPVCTRCRKTGRPELCTYDPRLLHEPHAAQHLPHSNLMQHSRKNQAAGRTTNRMHATSARPTQKLDPRAYRKSMELSSSLPVPDRPRPANVPSLASPSEPVSGAYHEEGDRRLIEDISFRGKGFKSVFAGSTSVYAIMSKVNFASNL